MLNAQNLPPSVVDVLLFDAYIVQVLHTEQIESQHIICVKEAIMSLVVSVSERFHSSMPVAAACFSESEVLHYATLLFFQNVTGAVLLLPPWMSQTHADVDGGEPCRVELELKESWSSVLLGVLRGHISSETELVLSDLQQGITGQVEDTYHWLSF